MKNANETKNTRKNRFEGRETTIKGEYINDETMEKQAFEIVVPYVRSKDKALEKVYEVLQLSDDCIINARKLEIINEAPKPVRYSNGKLIDFALFTFDDENEANEACDDGKVVKQVSIYQVTAFVWAIDDHGDYYTTLAKYETPVNITKANAREFVRMKFESETGDTFIALHDTKKHEVTRYAVLFGDDLEKCIIPDKDENK